MNAIRVGIVGYGNVGRATAALTDANAHEIERQVGCPVQVTLVSRRSAVAAHSLFPSIRYEQDWRQVVTSPEVDIVVESMGGTEAAREVVLEALHRGKPVVTANKNLLAKFGHEIQAAAISSGVPVGIEAAVAGGIPLLRAIRDGMAADRLTAVYGILNGTTNYILSQMEKSAVSFDDALREAQRAGYAESNPTSDIDGIDTRDKLCILARLAFDGWVSESAIHTEGIRSITSVDIDYAHKIECTIRLVGYASMNSDGIELSVRPWLVSRHSMLGKVEGVNNAVFLEGERIGRQMFYGPGAGPDATATAVVADLVEIGTAMTRGSQCAKRLKGFDEEKPLVLSAGSRPVGWYLRLTVKDRPGILARVAQCLADHNINIDAVLQMPNMAKDKLSFVVTVETISESRIRKVVEQVDHFEFLLSPVVLLRISS